MTEHQLQNQNVNNLEERYDLEAEKRRIAEATEEIKKEISERWQKRYAHAQIFPDKLNSINPDVIDFLLSFENTLFYNQLIKRFNMNENQRDILPQIVWKLCFDKNWQNLENSIKTTLNTPQAKEITEEINQVILFKIKDLSNKPFTLSKIKQEKINQLQLENIPINTAIQKYPELGEQLITPNYIKLKVFPEPVRPSIKNWLSDYTFNIGISNHDPVVRGNYLFKNENAQKLSSQDRDKLSQILKSFEEKTPLTINTNTRQVVFSAMFSQKKPITAIKPSFAQSARSERQSFPSQPMQKTEIYPEKQRILQPEEKKNISPQKPQSFQTDEERLSAWRKNLLNEPASSAGRKISEKGNDNRNQSGANNIRFSSPQTFSAEKPAIKNNFFAKRPIMKNVVDLKGE